jgi:hypothetical protein
MVSINDTEKFRYIENWTSHSFQLDQHLKMHFLISVWKRTYMIPMTALVNVFTKIGRMYVRPASDVAQLS